MLSRARRKINAVELAPQISVSRILGKRLGPTVFHRLARLLSIWHLTSLDAPTVAVCWCLALARVTHTHLPLWEPAALGLGTWSVYLGDRLLDARRAMVPLRTRHWFHWRHRLLFLPLAVINLLVALALVVWQMPAVIREHDSLLALAATVYFVTVHNRGTQNLHPHERSTAPATGSPAARLRHWFSKEAIVGLIFALVCAAPAAACPAGRFADLFLPVSACFLLAWMNCWLIEQWEAGHSGGTSRQIAFALGMLLLGTADLLLHASAAGAFLLELAASALLLAWLDRNRTHLKALYLRAAADLVLLTPLLGLLHSRS